MKSRERHSLQDVLERIEEARAEGRSGGDSLREGRISLSHGSGGKASHDLMEGVFGPALDNPVLVERGDAGVFTLEEGAEPLALTTDSFVVSPLFFPGGDIGRLAVNGTVNDLAVAGARAPRLSVAVILEEGFPLPDLQRVVDSIRDAADAAGATVVAGDTKVVERGYGDGLYVNTSGVGRVRVETPPSSSAARPGDRVLVSGPLGDHGVAVMIARQRLELESEIRSDTAPLNGMVEDLLDTVGDSVRCLRDATRGGLASTLNEIADRSGVGVALEDEAVPVRRDVRAACEILGIDPLHMANEGKLAAVVAPEAADEALEVLRAHPLGEEAALVGEVVESPPGMVFVRTGLGGRRVLDMLVGDALPRIC